MNLGITVYDALTLLENDPDYKAITRIQPRKAFANSNGEILLKGLVVDTETTGTNPEQHAIIELGMVLFEFDPETGVAFKVLGSFDELEDPGFPISMESTAIHGITDEMVRSKKFDDDSVSQFLKDVSIVIAHNAKFDRAFLEKRLPIFEALPWACTFAQIDWNGEGLGSAKLEYIAYKYGFFYDAHRAEIDCFALLEILQKELPKSKELVLKTLWKKLHIKSYTIYALESPFETKEILKAKGYRWNGEKKCWHNTCVGDEAIKSEALWLKENVYGGKPAKVEIEVLNCLTRFSNRIGNCVIKEI